jgi:hypothetical protein
MSPSPAYSAHHPNVGNWHAADRRYTTPMVGYCCIAVICLFVAQPYFSYGEGLAVCVSPPSCTKRLTFNVPLKPSFQPHNANRPFFTAAA